MWQAIFVTALVVIPIMLVAAFIAYLVFASATSQEVELHWFTPRKLRKKRNAIAMEKLNIQHETLKMHKTEIQNELLKRALNEGGLISDE